MRTRAIGAVVVLSLFATAPRDVRAADGPSGPGEVVEISFEGAGMTVQGLLALAAKHSGRTILWSEQDKAVHKKIVGAQPLRVPASEILDAVTDLLASQEVVLVPTGNARPGTLLAMDARWLQNQFILRQRATTVVMDDATAARIEGRSGLYVTTTFHVPGHAELRDLRAALARMTTANQVGSVQEIPSARVITATDFAPNIVAMYRFLKTVPVVETPPPAATVGGATPGTTSPSSPRAPAEPGRVEFFSPRIARAADVHRTLVELLGPRGADAADRLPRFSLDHQGNQVSMVGTSAQIEQARAIVMHLDVERPAPR